MIPHTTSAWLVAGLTVVLCACTSVKTVHQPLAAEDLRRDEKGEFIDTEGPASKPLSDSARENFKPVEVRPKHEVSGPAIRLGIVEFDDQGMLRQEKQLIDICEELEARRDEPLLLVFFAHGWFNDATPRNENLNDFRKLLITLRESGTYRGEIAGVYLGWRGQTLRSTGNSLLDKVPGIFTFGSRKRAAERVGRLSCTEAILSIAASARLKNGGGSAAEPLRRKRTNVKTIVVGHSFGGLVVERSFLQAMLGYSIMHAPTEEDVHFQKSKSKEEIAKQEKFLRDHISDWNGEWKKLMGDEIGGWDDSLAKKFNHAFPPESEKVDENKDVVDEAWKQNEAWKQRQQEKDKRGLLAKYLHAANAANALDKKEKDLRNEVVNQFCTASKILAKIKPLAETLAKRLTDEKALHSLPPAQARPGAAAPQSATPHLVLRELDDWLTAEDEGLVPVLCRLGSELHQWDKDQATEFSTNLEDARKEFASIGQKLSKAKTADKQHPLLAAAAASGLRQDFKQWCGELASCLLEVARPADESDNNGGLLLEALNKLRAKLVELGNWVRDPFHLKARELAKATKIRLDACASELRRHHKEILLTEEAIHSQHSLGRTLEEVQQDPPADLVILINPASEAVLARQMQEIWEKHRAGTHFRRMWIPRGGDPQIISISGPGDESTNWAFPIATKLAPLRWIFGASDPGRLRRTTLPEPVAQKPEDQQSARPAKFVHQRRLFSNTAPQLRCMQTHHITTATDKDDPNAPKLEETDSYKASPSPLWVVDAPEEVIKGHGDIFNLKILGMVKFLVDKSNALRRARPVSEFEPPLPAKTPIPKPPTTPPRTP